MIALAATFDRSTYDPQLWRNKVRAEQNRQQQDQHNRDQKHKKDTRLEQTEDNTASFANAAAVVVPASQERIATFETDLTLYETATVEALMKNARQMEIVHAQMEALLAQAHVMDDGRRVFRTQDGTQVFDEFGQQVSREEIHPDVIPDSAPFWEEYSPIYSNKNRLSAERQNLLAYQDRLDAARDTIAEGNITEADLDALQTSLANDMPDPIRRLLPTNHPAAQIGAEAGIATPPTPAQATTQATPSLNGLEGFAPPALTH